LVRAQSGVGRLGRSQALSRERALPLPSQLRTLPLSMLLLPLPSLCTLSASLKSTLPEKLCKCSLAAKEAL